MRLGPFTSLDARLDALVASRYKGRPGGHPVRWWGRRGGATRTTYVCYVCDRVIDTESAKYPMTVHASEAIEKHALTHENLTLETYSVDDIPTSRRASW